MNKCKMEHMKTVVTMSGGGAKGGFEVGALRGLVEAGIRPEAYYGTSVGALNALGMALHELERLQAEWREIKGQDDIIWAKFPLALPWSTGLYSMHPLRKRLDALVKGATPKAEAVVCYVDTKDGSVCYRSTKDTPILDMAKWAEASSCIPVAMELVDDRYADGGVREQTPLKRAIDDGADRIIVILCNPVDANLRGAWKPKFPHLMSTAMRTVDILTHEIFLNDLKVCQVKNSMTGRYRKIETIVIAPPKPLADTLEFTPERIEHDMKLGYETAKKVIGEIGPVDAPTNG